MSLATKFCLFLSWKRNDQRPGKRVNNSLPFYSCDAVLIRFRLLQENNFATTFAGSERWCFITFYRQSRETTSLRYLRAGPRSDGGSPRRPLDERRPG